MTRANVLRLDLTRAQIKKLGSKELIAVDVITACTSCEATFTAEEQHAFDPKDNDHCPKCGGRGSLTEYYGDPESQVRGWQLGLDDFWVKISARRPRKK